MDCVIEIWRQVPSIPEMEASSLGRVRRKPFRGPLPNGGTRAYIPKPTYGYRVKSSGLAGFRMIIRIESLGKTFKPARLVCEAFHGLAPDGKNIAMHGDDNPANNKPGNLSWGTSKQNLNASQFIRFCRSRTGANHPRIKGTQSCLLS